MSIKKMHDIFIFLLYICGSLLPFFPWLAKYNNINLNQIISNETIFMFNSLIGIIVLISIIKIHFYLNELELYLNKNFFEKSRISLEKVTYFEFIILIFMIFLFILKVIFLNNIILQTVNYSIFLLIAIYNIYALYKLTQIMFKIKPFK